MLLFQFQYFYAKKHNFSWKDLSSGTKNVSKYNTNFSVYSLWKTQKIDIGRYNYIGSLNSFRYIASIDHHISCLQGLLGYAFTGCIHSHDWGQTGEDNNNFHTFIQMMCDNFNTNEQMAWLLVLFPSSPPRPYVRVYGSYMLLLEHYEVTYHLSLSYSYIGLSAKSFTVLLYTFLP